MESINKEALDKREIIKNIFKKDETKKKTLLPDPMMHLNYVLGYTSGLCPVVKYDKSIDSKKFILFSSGNTLIKFDYDNIRQKFFFGHSKPINNYIITNDGQTIFSCQESKNSIIRVWSANHLKCVKMLTTPYEKITSMSVSKDNRLLCTVGLESYNKEMIILWDISFVDDIKVFVRQGSHFNVKAIKFSPFEQNILVSCGKENIKFWRIKNDDHLGGKAVVLNQYARNNNFLCVDFDNPFIGEACKGRVFIGSDSGCIFQISCNSMELESIYKIQDSPILALSVNDAYCATGSQDGFLRVWPIDFSEFILEAKHDSGVCSVDISFDALEIVCGTLNGSIGTLNISSKQYKTILRSPPNNINFMTAHPSGNLLFTIEDDFSVRVWDVEQKSEAFQYVSSKDPPTVVAAPNKNIFACGFTSGILKVFDLDNTAIIYECRAFNTPVKALKYSQKDSILISMSSYGHMSLHDALNNYMQIKLIKIDSPAVNVDLVLSQDEDYFASIGPESNCVIVWSSKSYCMRNRIPIYNFFVQKICFITRNIIAIVLENCCMQFYSLSLYEGVFLKEFTNIHMEKITQFLSTRNYKYLISGGAEGMIKIWDTKMLFRNYTSYQQFIGHPSSIKALICLEQKSLLVTTSENSGIFFWNYLGDLTFTETEINLELERLGNLKESGREAIGKMKNSRTLSAFGNSKIKRQQIGEHLDKIYNSNNTANVNYVNNYTNIKTESSIGGEKNLGNNLDKNVNNEKRLKIDLNNYSADALKFLNMLPVEFDQDDKDNLPTEISQSLMLNSNSFNRYFTREEMYNILLFKARYVPEKIDRL